MNVILLSVCAAIVLLGVFCVPASHAQEPTASPKSLPDGVSVGEVQASAKAGIRQVLVSSPYQRQANLLQILLPTDFATERAYPVLYILPVNTGINGPWGCPLEPLRDADLATRLGMIMVVPAFDQDPWMGDLPEAPAAGVWVRQRGYVEDVIIPIIDGLFPTQGNKGRYLLGFSKSGPTALAMFLQKPDHYTAVAIYDNADPQIVDERFESWGLAAVYGKREHYRQSGPLAQIALAQGNGVAAALIAGPPRIILAAGSAQYGGVNQVREALKQAELPFVDLVFEGMGHSWREAWLPNLVQGLHTIGNR